MSKTVTKKQENKNVPAKKEETALSAPMDQAWGSEGLDSKDILVPKLLLMQGLSKKVNEGEAQQGQVVDSISGKVVGGIKNIKTKEGEPITMIAFSSFKTWIESEKIGDKYEYRKQYAMTPENADQAQEEVVNGISVRRDRCLNFYVLLKDQIADGTAFPYCVSFRRTSMKAGRKIATIAAQLKALGSKPLAFKNLHLSVTHMQNDQGQFWGFDVGAGENSSTQELNEAFRWHQALKTSTVRVDDSDLKQPEKSPAASEESQDY